MTYMPKFIAPSDESFHGFSAYPEAELLKNLSEKNLSHLLVNLDLAAPETAYQERLEAELQIIIDKGYCEYFLIVADYVGWAREHGIAVGPGRGSGPCSLVGFALGITSIDPIRYKLPFERFVNPEREVLPDFDLEFCDERRCEVTDYIQSRYGADRVAQISSDDICPLPSRLVICDRPLTEIVSLYTNPESGFPAANMNVAQIANSGLVQFNAINQRALTLIQRNVRKLANAGNRIDIDKIALDDTNTYRLLSTGEKSNIDVLDDEHYKNTLKVVRPDCFEHLCAVIALSQPRLKTYISQFVERKQEPASIHYFHPALKKITADTFGLVLYQEQVMHIAHEIAGFTYAQADSFRRALKKSDSKTKLTYKSKFIDGAVSFGLSQPEAADLYDYIALCGQYSFNKSHAVAFAMIAYQTAWLKTNFPHPA